MRLAEIQTLGRETGEIRERREQEINIKDLSNRQSRETETERQLGGQGLRENGKGRRCRRQRQKR